MNASNRDVKQARAGRATRLQVAYLPIGELRPDPANPRLHSKKQIRQIANSIEAFDFNVPILIDRDSRVIAGHGRLLACRELGWSEVPTLCLEHLSPAQARAFMITDNRLTEIATWDDQLLAQQLKDLSLLGLDFSLELTGFEMGEIDLRIASLEDEPDPADDPADAVPELPATPPISKIGDLWHLGRHCVLCGNALERADFAALMGEERATLVFTDPPYNVPIDGVMPAGSVRSTIDPFRWPRARWTKRSLPHFSLKLARTSPNSAPMARSTSSAWIGVISMSC
jgi:ParB-like nuclease domain